MFLIALFLYMFVSCSGISLSNITHNWIHRTQLIQQFSHIYSNKFVVFIKPDNEKAGRLSDFINIRNIFSQSLTFYSSIFDSITFFRSFKHGSYVNFGMTTVFMHLDHIRIPEFNTVLKARHTGLMTWLCEIPSNESISKLKNVYVPLDSKFFLINWVEDGRAEIMELYNLPRSETQEVRYLGGWDEENGLTIIEKDWAKRRENLKGVALKYFTYNNRCSATCKYETIVQDYLSMFQCFNMKLWDDLSERFNFTTKYLDYDSSDKVGDFVSKLAEGECDSGPLSLIISSTRMEKIRFMWPLYKSRVLLMTAVAGNEINISSFLKPCSGKFWFALASWLTITGIILAALNYVVDRVVHHKTSFTSSNFATFYIPFQAICSQACQHASSWSGIRIVLFLCYVVPVIFLSAYSGRIISSLAKPARIPFKNLKEFEKNGEYRLATYTNSFFLSILETDSLFEESRQNSLIVDEMPEDSGTAFMELCTKKLTLITEMSAVALSPPHCSVYFLDDIVGQYYGTMALTPDFPFAEPVKRYIQKYATSGIRLKNLYKIALNDLKFELSFNSWDYKRKNSDVKSIEPASIDNLTLLFAILLTGMTLSIFIFILELWHKKKTLKHNLRQGIGRKLDC